MLVGGFFCPPIGSIDSSVIQAVGLLFAFGVIAQLPILIEVAGEVRIQRGDTTIEISKDDDDDN